MKKTFCVVLLLLLFGCGPKKGGKYKFKNINQEVKVISTGNFKSQAIAIKELAKTINDNDNAGESPYSRYIVINKNLDSLINNNGLAEAVTVEWNNKKYLDLYKKWQYYRHLRVIKTDEFNQIFVKVKSQ